jgi:nicotinate-nucleotide pyrophosphorylase (carboxylating)
LDDGVLVTANHISILGGTANAVKAAKEKLGYLHRIVVEVSKESEVKEAIDAGADAIAIAELSSKEFGRLVTVAREMSSSVSIECAGKITLTSVRDYAEAGAQLIRVEALTSSAPAVEISFRVQS